MSLYEGVKTSIRVDSRWSEKFEVIVGMYQISALSLSVITVEVDSVAELVSWDVLTEMLYDDHFVLLSETVEGFWLESWKRKVFDSKI